MATHGMQEEDIFAAARTNDVFVIATLLGRGVSFNEFDLKGRTPLHICSSHGCFESAELLLVSKACDPNLQDKESGYTALHHALYNEKYRVALLLIKHGAKLILLQEELIRENGDSYYGASSHLRERRISPIDHEGLSPLDMLTLQLSSKTNHEEITCSEVVVFGKADFFLGIILPKAADDVLKPRPVTTLASLNIEYIACSKFHSGCITTEGRLYTWGLGSSGKLGHGNESSQPFPALCRSLSKYVVTGIACSDNHMLAIVDSGALFSWGGNRFGQLGHTGNLECCFTPKRVEKLRRYTVCGVAAGDTHSVCFTSTGEVWTWGSNKHGQLGSRITSTTGGKLGAPGSSTPLNVAWHHNHSHSHQEAPLSEVLAVCASHSCTLVLRRGALYRSQYASASGSGTDVTNEVYQWGNGSHTPSKVQFLPKKRAAKVDSNHVSIIEMSSDSFRPINILSIAVGNNHCVGVASAGSVYTWGLGVAQLGHGISQQQKSHLSFPQPVEELLHEHVISVSAAGDRTSVVTSRGDMYTWGTCSNTGALGHGKHTYQPVPRVVLGVKGIRQVATGADHTLVLVSARVPPLPHSRHQVTTSETADDIPTTTSADGSINDIDHNLIHCEVNSNQFKQKILSLQDLCEVEIARNVNLRNVIAVLSFAEQYSRVQLFNFLLQFVARNLDIILMHLLMSGKVCSSEVDFLIYCFDDPFGQYLAKTKKLCENADYEDAITLLASTFREENSHLVKPTANQSSFPSSELDCTEASPLPADLPSIIKLLKSAKKKLSAIAVLEKKVISSTPVSEEEKRKLSKKDFFVVQLKRLEELACSLQGDQTTSLPSTKEDSVRQAPSELHVEPDTGPRKAVDVGKEDVANITAAVAVACNEKKRDVAIKSKKKTKFRPLVTVTEKTMTTPVIQKTPPSTHSPWKIAETRQSYCDMSTSHATTDMISLDYAVTKKQKHMQKSSCTSINALSSGAKKGKGVKVSLSTFLSSPAPSSQPPPSTQSDFKNPQCPWVVPKPAPISSPLVPAGTTTPLSGTNTTTPTKMGLARIQSEEEDLRNDSTLKVMPGNSIPWLLDRRSIRSDSFEEVMWREQVEQQKELERLQEAKELRDALAAISLLEEGDGGGKAKATRTTKMKAKKAHASTNDKQRGGRRRRVGEGTKI